MAVRAIAIYVRPISHPVSVQQEENSRTQFFTAVVFIPSIFSTKLFSLSRSLSPLFYFLLALSGYFKRWTKAVEAVSVCVCPVYGSRLSTRAVAWLCRSPTQIIKMDWGPTPRRRPSKRPNGHRSCIYTHTDCWWMRHCLFRHEPTSFSIWFIRCLPDSILKLPKHKYLSKT